MRLIATLLLLLSLTLLEACSSLSSVQSINIETCVFEDKIGYFYCPVQDISLFQSDKKNDYIVISIDDLNKMLIYLQQEGKKF